MSKKTEGKFTNNKINIEIAAPKLIIPFKQETLDEIKISEVWILNIGDLLF